MKVLRPQQRLGKHFKMFIALPAQNKPRKQLLALSIYFELELQLILMHFIHSRTAQIFEDLGLSQNR